MDSVLNEERAAASSERAGARQKHQRGYRAPPAPRRAAPALARRTRLIDAGASRGRANLDSGGSKLASPELLRSLSPLATSVRALRATSLYRSRRFVLRFGLYSKKLQLCVVALRFRL